MRSIEEQIRSHQGSLMANGPLVYTILLVPRATELCRKVLEDEGVAGDVTISEVCMSLKSRVAMTAYVCEQFKMELIPIEDDLLSMEMEDVVRDVYLVSR